MHPGPSSLLEISAEIQRLVLILSEGEDLHDKFELWNTKRNIQRSCNSLLSLVLGPLEYTVSIAESCHESQALAFITALGVPDLIGEREISQNDINRALDSVVDPRYLSVAMHCVTELGYFDQVEKDGTIVYRNNTLSRVLSESHPSSLKSALGFIGDEGCRATSRLMDAAKRDTNPETLSAANIAFGFNGPIFSWMSSPENSWRTHRMGKAMGQLHKVANFHIFDDFDWTDLKSPIVDIGGGIGSFEKEILKNSGDSPPNFVIFDLPKTIDKAKEFWSPLSPVTLVAGNFLEKTLEESNIPSGMPTYIIRHVLHDWEDEIAISILRLVHEAMPSSGSLVLVELLSSIEASRLVRATNLQLLALNKGIIRTPDEMELLLGKAGFKVRRVVNVRAIDSIIEAVKS